MVDRGALSVSMNLFSVHKPRKKTRSNCDDLALIVGIGGLGIIISNYNKAVVSGLKLSFILCRDVSALFQKVSVSQLLAVLYILSPSNKKFSMLPSFDNVLSESKWAWYFHQASLGTHPNVQIDIDDEAHPNVQINIDDEGSCLPSSTSLSLPIKYV